MRRWHSETALMFRRWREEMEKHGYDWRNPPSDKDACHCTAGIGSMRKRTAHDCGNTRCGLCHSDKWDGGSDRARRDQRRQWDGADRYNREREVIDYEQEAYG